MDTTAQLSQSLESPHIIMHIWAIDLRGFLIHVKVHPLLYHRWYTAVVMCSAHMFRVSVVILLARTHSCF